MSISKYLVSALADIKACNNQIIIIVPISKKTESKKVVLSTFLNLGYKADIKDGRLILRFDRKDKIGMRDAVDELGIKNLNFFVTL